MAASGNISRRGLLQLAAGLLVTAPSRSRAYSFLPGYIYGVDGGSYLVQLDYAGLERRILHWMALRGSMQKIMSIYGGPLPVYLDDGGSAATHQDGSRSKY